jgi:glutaredoxin
MRTVTLYTKRDCCLCDEALEVIGRVRSEHPFDLEKVNIEADAGLSARYGERIPVVLVDGIEEFVYRVDEESLMLMVAHPAGASA